MSEITGHCLCGRISFHYNGDLGPASYCHCDDCRRCTGSAFNVSIRLYRDKLVIINENDLGVYKYIADSGNEMMRYFCTKCGSPIMTVHPQWPQLVWVKAGIIDQTESIRPAQESWKSRKVPWADIHVKTSHAENPK
jgi:hypothetical protein